MLISGSSLVLSKFFPPLSVILGSVSNTLLILPADAAALVNITTKLANTTKAKDI